MENESPIQVEEDVQETLLFLDKLHPGFAKSHRDFSHFLNLTVEDLQGKMVSITTQSRMLKNKRKLRHYLNCQKFMLHKHLRRLQKFNQEISDRIVSQGKHLEVIPSSPIPSGSGDPANEECERLKTPDEFRNIEEEFREAAIDCAGLEVSRPSTSSAESFSDQSFDSSSTTDVTMDGGTRETSTIRQLELDMSKMKRRCKHILDVTDRYCVLNSETDLHLKIDDFNKSILDQEKSPPLSPWTNKSPSTDEVDGGRDKEVSKSDSCLNPQKLPSSIDSQGAVKLTMESICNHLLVIMKTYTKKHSRSDSAWTQPTLQ